MSKLESTLTDNGNKKEYKGIAFKAFIKTNNKEYEIIVISADSESLNNAWKRLRLRDTLNLSMCCEVTVQKYDNNPTTP